MSEQHHPHFRRLSSVVSLRCMDAIRYCGAIEERRGADFYHVEQIERAMKECLEAVAKYRENTRKASEVTQ